MAKQIMLLLLTTSLFFACGREGNVADCEEGQAGVPCSEKTPDEQARIAMNDGDFATAVTLLAALVKEEPKEYQRYPLLGAAYAALAGFELLNIVLDPAGGTGGSLTETIGSYVPGPGDVGDAKYKVLVGYMNTAVTTLKQIPASWLNSAESKYKISTNYQKSLYQTVYSVMYLNQFAISAETGAFDAAKLETMTDAEADAFIDNLIAAKASESGEDGEKLSAKIDKTLAAIDETEGGSNREKLLEYLNPTPPAEGETPAE